MKTLKETPRRKTDSGTVKRRVVVTPAKRPTQQHEAVVVGNSSLPASAILGLSGDAANAFLDNFLTRERDPFLDQVIKAIEDARAAADLE